MCLVFGPPPDFRDRLSFKKKDGKFFDAKFPNILKTLCVHRVSFADFAFNGLFMNLCKSAQSVVKEGCGLRVVVVGFYPAVNKSDQYRANQQQVAPDSYPEDV